MLVLSRQKGQSIMIGDHVKIIVHSIRSNKVRLMIEAPQSVEVWRKEIFDQIQEAKKNAKDG